MHSLRDGEITALQKSQKMSPISDFIFYIPQKPRKVQCQCRLIAWKFWLSLYDIFNFQALNKKESKGGLGSPCGDDSDHEVDFNLTPRTEAKYNKLDEEFHMMMQRNQINGVRVSQIVMSQIIPHIL